LDKDVADKNEAAVKVPDFDWKKSGEPLHCMGNLLLLLLHPRYHPTRNGH
jgi:hypothetical protein